MKTISSTTECFIQEQVALKFQKKLDNLKKKKTALDEKWDDLSEQIHALDEQLSNVGELSGLQEDEVYALEEDLVDIIKKACAKTLAGRLEQIGLKIVDERKAIDCIISPDCFFNAIRCEYIVNIKNNADKIKKQIQELTDQRELSNTEYEKTVNEIDKINEKIDKHVKDIVVKLELGGNYDDLMKMISKIKA